MKLTTSTREGGLYFGGIYSAEYFAVLREWRIRVGVARWYPRCIFEYSIYLCYYRISNHRHSTSCARVCIYILRHPKSDIPFLYFVERLKFLNIAVFYRYAYM